MKNPISDWHEVVKNKDAKLLKSLLDKNVVFHSPILFKPQKGRKLTMVYLLSAAKIFEGTDFHYVKELISGHDAVLEFHAEIDGIIIDGVDIISWNPEGKIIEFKVMLRPLKAIDKVGGRMKNHLESMSLIDKLKLKI